MDIDLHVAHPHASATNAPVYWYGGKGKLASRLLPLIPDGRVYVEPYGGAASLMFAKAPHPVEVYNDLCGDLVNLFRALQAPERFKTLSRRLRSTLYSRQEFSDALAMLADAGSDPDERAWAFFVCQNQGFGGVAETDGDWGKAFVSNSGMAQTCASWARRQNSLNRYHARLMAVQIDNRDALDVIHYWDSAATVFYFDPPYVSATRPRSRYQHECDDIHHASLVENLLNLSGKVIVSGYHHEIYLPLDEAGWQRVEFDTTSHAAGKVRGSKMQGEGAALAHTPRRECVWISPGAVQQSTLF